MKSLRAAIRSYNEAQTLRGTTPFIVYDWITDSYITFWYNSRSFIERRLNYEIIL